MFVANYPTKGLFNKTECRILSCDGVLSDYIYVGTWSGRPDAKA